MNANDIPRTQLGVRVCVCVAVGVAYGAETPRVEYHQLIADYARQVPFACDSLKRK